ncbi:MAG TPA: hypothetical protein VM734_33625 [Kofleriaceae bacterium]|nr:hypothetical protein [Kofleriaceae bacterium]
MRGAALLVAAAVAGVATARAEPRPRVGVCRPWAWRAVMGTVSAADGCAAMVLTTDASGSDRATGRAIYQAAVPATGRIALTVQRLTGDAGSVQIEVAGAWLILGDGRAGVYTSEAQWAETGLRPYPPALAGRRLIDPSRVELDLAPREVTVRIDGVAIGRWPLPARMKAGTFSVWIHGPRGTRSRLRVSDVQVPPPP